MGVAERKERDREARRRRILDAARELFVTEGMGDVTMRKIAARIEYSPMSLYQYFPSREHILATLARESFAELCRALEGMGDATGDPLENLRRGLHKYVEFGLSHREDYELTFIQRNPGLETADGTPAGLDAFNILRCAVSACVAAGIIAVETEEASQALWAAIHGVTALLITRPAFPFIDRQRLVSRVIDSMLEGMRPRRRPSRLPRFPRSLQSPAPRNRFPPDSHDPERRDP